MKHLDLAQKVLHDVLINDLTFKKALKNTFPKDGENKKYLSLVTSLTGCELRHHLLFKKIVENLNKEFSDVEKEYLYLSLADIFFIKHYSKDDIILFLKSSLNGKYDDNIEKILNFEGKIGDLLNIDKASIEYISIRFNTPIWLIKMWNKHFGKANAFKSLKANVLPSRSTYRFNENSDKKLNSDFVKTDIENIYTYNGKNNLHKLDVYEDGTIFSLKPAYKQIFDKYINGLINEYTIFSGSDDSLIKELYARSKGEKGINVIVPDLSKRADILRFIRTKNIKNINLFTGSETISFKTGISYKQDLIVFNPVSSSFDKIRSYPDYLLHFKKEQFDELISKQKQQLKDLSEFVSDGGTLIYIVDTMNKKESSAVMTDFLLNHNDFELVYERQIFPFEKDDISLYYAVIRKNEQND